MTVNSNNGPIFPTQAMARLRHEHAIIDAFERLETARQAMRDATAELGELIRHDPEGMWQQRWQAFLDAGGVAPDELCRWMVHGRSIRAVKRYGHLRLLASNQRKRS